MVGSLGRRADGQEGGQPQETGSVASRQAEARVMIIAPGPADAGLLLAEASGPGVVTAVCLDEGGAQERLAFGQAVSDPGRQGYRVAGEPRILASGGDAAQAVLEEIRTLRPDRIVTTGPDAHPDDLGVSRRRSDAALAAIRAAVEYRRETGRPLFVDCRSLEVADGQRPAARPRYGAPGNWLVRGNDGRLSAYAATPGVVLRWTESAAGRWSGPELLDAPGLLPGLTVAQGPDGYVRLIGLRRTEKHDGTVAVAVVCATQYQSGRPISPWQSLGNPHRAEPERGRYVGFPVAAFDDDGTLHVFLRNDEHTVNTCHQTVSGSWSPWRHLKGSRTADEMVALRVPDGTVELFARLRDVPGVARWSRSGPKGAWAEDRSPHVYAYPGSLSAAPECGALRYRYADTGELCHWQWGEYAPVTLGSLDVNGRVAGTTGVGVGGWPCTVLVATDHYGRCLVGCHVDGRQDSGVWWSSTEQWCLVPPALVLDRDGQVTIATLGPDARLTTTRRAAGEQSLELGPWL